MNYTAVVRRAIVGTSCLRDATKSRLRWSLSQTGSRFYGVEGPRKTDNVFKQVSRVLNAVLAVSTRSLNAAPLLLIAPVLNTNLMFSNTSTVRPILEYGSVVWSPWKKKYVKNIEQIQRRFTKLSYGMMGLNYE